MTDTDARALARTLLSRAGPDNALAILQEIAAVTPGTLALLRSPLRPRLMVSYRATPCDLPFVTEYVRRSWRSSIPY
jgi:hypothetical protein